MTIRPTAMTSKNVPSRTRYQTTPGTGKVKPLVLEIWTTVSEFVVACEVRRAELRESIGVKVGIAVLPIAFAPLIMILTVPAPPSSHNPQV